MATKEAGDEYWLEHIPEFIIKWLTKHGIHNSFYTEEKEESVS